MSDSVELAQRVAEEVLYPNATAVDLGERPVKANLDVLASHGFYGGMLPPELGGLGIDLETAYRITEILAGGCLATTITLGQHQGITAMIAGQGSDELRAKWLPDLASGQVRSGAVFVGAIPGPARLTVRETGDGYRLDGAAPWVSGWGMVDVLGTAARDTDDNINWLIVDAEESASLRVHPQALSAANATNTVVVEFDDHRVPADRLVTVNTLAAHASGEAVTKRLNGALGLGVAARAVRLLDSAPWTSELDDCRRSLFGDTEVDEARSQVAAFAVRAAAALVAARGSGAMLTDSVPQRLLREAALMTVFSSRPAIQAGLLRRLGPV